MDEAIVFILITLAAAAPFVLAAMICGLLEESERSNGGIG